MPLIILFYSLIWPILGLVYGVKYFRSKTNHLFLYFFFITGAIIIIPYEDGDIMGYLHRMQLYSSFSFSDYVEEIGKSLIGIGNDGFEIFLTTNTFLVSRFTTNIHVAFVLTTTVFYIVWIRLMRYLYNDYRNLAYKNKTALALLLAFAVYIFFVRAINGRFYLAYWVFVLSFYEVIVNRNHKYVFLSLTTIFIHQSFIFVNLLIGLYYLVYPLKKFKVLEIVLFILIIVGTVYSELGLSLVSQNLDLLGDSVQSRYSAYTSEKYIEGWLNRDRAWFQIYRGYFVFYTLVACIIILRLNTRILFNDTINRVYYFFLLFWAANAFTYNIASMGERFRNVLVGVGILMLFKIFVSNNHKRIPVYLWIFFAAFLLSKLVTFRIIAEYLPIWIFSPFSLLMNFFFQENAQ